MAFKTQLMCFSYSCSTQSEELTQRVKYSNKILLPPSILQQLNDNDNISNDILFFKIINDKNQFHQICGVQEFSAPPGVVYSPYHVMEGLGIEQGLEILQNPKELRVICEEYANGGIEFLIEMKKVRDHDNPLSEYEKEFFKLLENK